MTPLNPYTLIYHLLVDHLQAMTHEGRMAWLEQGNLHYLLAQVAPDQSTTVIVPHLLTAASTTGAGAMPVCTNSLSI
jgi:hypothetical protein